MVWGLGFRKIPYLHHDVKAPIVEGWSFFSLRIVGSLDSGLLQFMEG